MYWHRAEKEKSREGDKSGIKGKRGKRKKTRDKDEKSGKKRREVGKTDNIKQGCGSGLFYPDPANMKTNF